MLPHLCFIREVVKDVITCPQVHESVNCLRVIKWVKRPGKLVAGNA